MTQIQKSPCGTLAPIFVDHVAHVRRWAEEVLEGLEQFGDVGHTKLDEVENRSRDGFIPFTDGGFNGIAYADLASAEGSGAVPAAIQPYIDSAHKDFDEEWDREHPEATVEMLHASTPEDEGQLQLPGLERGYRQQHPLLEEYWTAQHESLSEGGTYFYKVRALFYGDQHASEDRGDPEVLFCVGINTDFEYGRDSIPWITYYGKPAQQTQWCWEKTVKLSDLNEELIDEIIREAVNALNNL